jgi:hypothetical protein
MNRDVCTHDQVILSGDSARHPIEPRCAALAALLLVAGIEPAPRRALPDRPIAARSGAFNCGF